MERRRTKYRGVYERDSVDRMFKGKPDVCFDITFKVDRRKIWEKVGWISEGYSAKLAADIRGERLRGLRHGNDLPNKTKAPFMKDVWERYKTWVENNKARHGRDDVGRYQVHLKDRFENRRLNEISSFDLERTKIELIKEGLSPASVRHCLVLVRQIYNKAITWGMYQGTNPIKGVKLPILQNQRTRFLSRGEAALLLQKLSEMKTDTLHDMSLVSLHTGMRAGEIFALKVNDIDFDNEIITVREPKNKKTRHAYMTRAVKEVLRKRMSSEPEALIFPDRNGAQTQSISKNFKRVVKALKFNEGVTDPRECVTFHTLRHTFASWLAIQGEALYTIKELLGHKSMGMTERYSHLSPDHKKKAIANLENFSEQNRPVEGETQHG